MPAVSNASPLIYLAKLHKLELLKFLYGRIIIPKAVFEEIILKGKAFEASETYAIESAIGKWIHVQELPQELIGKYQFLDKHPRLHRGEIEALKLAKESGAMVFITDDLDARYAAKILGLRLRGTLGVLAEAHKKGFLALPILKKSIDALIDLGFRVDIAVYKEILHRAEEFEGFRKRIQGKVGKIQG